MALMARSALTPREAKTLSCGEEESHSLLTNQKQLHQEDPSAFQHLPQRKSGGPRVDPVLAQTAASKLFCFTSSWKLGSGWAQEGGREGRWPQVDCQGENPAKLLPQCTDCLLPIAPGSLHFLGKAWPESGVDTNLGGCIIP